MCAQPRLRSAWVSAQSDQSSLSALRKIGSLATLDAQADLSVNWAHTHFDGFCHEAAHISFIFQSRCMKNKLGHSKTCKKLVAYSEDSDQPAHLYNLITVFAVLITKLWIHRWHGSSQGTCQFVSFAVLWLTLKHDVCGRKWEKQNTIKQ